MGGAEKSACLEIPGYYRWPAAKSSLATVASNDRDLEFKIFWEVISHLSEARDRRIRETFNLFPPAAI